MGVPGPCVRPPAFTQLQTQQPRRSALGATRAADPKLKFIFPTVADSWSGCGSHEAGKFCRHRAERRPGRPSAHRLRAVRARAVSAPGRQSGVGREPAGPGRHGGPRPGAGIPQPCVARLLAATRGAHAAAPTPLPSPTHRHHPDSVSLRILLGPEGADLPGGEGG